MPKISTRYQRPQLQLGAFSRGLKAGWGSAVAAVTWNPADKGADIVLSGSNLIASGTSMPTQQTVRATASKASGLYYFEVKVDAGGNDFVMVGITTSALATNDYIGNNATSYGYFGVNGQKYNAGGAAYGDTFTTAAVIGVAVNFTTGKIWFAKNNVWQASGDPVAGTNEAFSGVSGTYFPGLSMFTDTYQATARFKAADFTYSPPTGFSAWES